LFTMFGPESYGIRTGFGPLNDALNAHTDVFGF
jgi:hypothetical protein